MKAKELNEQLCPKCKIGQDSYMLDNHSPFCPYIQYNNGKECSFFKEIIEHKADVEIEEQN